MKNLYFIVIASLFSFSIAFGQKGNILLSYSAGDFYSGDSLNIDSVFVINLSKDCDTTVYGPNPELLLSWATGIEELNSKNGIQVEQNFPNPFSGSTKCNIKISDKKDIKITLTNNSGSQVASFEKSLPKGIHSFTIETSSRGTYFLTVSDGEESGTLKLISQKGSSFNRAKILYSGTENNDKNFKAIEQTEEFSFKPGDVLKMTAYAYGYEEGVIEDTPEEDMTYTYELNPNLLTFTGDTLSGYVPFITHFYPTTNLPTISQYFWDFGDGETSTLQMPTHTYFTHDMWYTVSLTVTSGSNAYTCQRMNYVHAFPDTIPVNFIADVTNGIAPQTIQFTGYSSTSNGVWQWNFGDGGSAQYVQNPVYTYTSTGVFTVSAQYMDNYGVTTIIKEDYIHIDFCPLTVTDEDGNLYHNLKIGNQCWMKENLNTGVKINASTQATDNNIIEKHCYNDEDSKCDEYGGLYHWNELMNWADIEGTQGICPDGWHIPTLADWSSLVNFLGGEDVAGGKLKETGVAHWDYGNNATNSSGFTALGAGYLFFGNYGSSQQILQSGYLDSSTKENGYPISLLLKNNLQGVSFEPFTGYYHHSVRCIKD